MSQTHINCPDQCPHRAPLKVGVQNAFCCRLVAQLAVPAALGDCVVSAEVCRACCCRGRATPQRPNAVVASLIYDVAGKLIRGHSLVADEAARLVEVRQFAIRFLEEGKLPTADTQAAAIDMRAVRPPGHRLRDNRSPSPNGDERRVVERVKAAPRKTARPARRPGWQVQQHIGLVGVNNQRGLGCQNRDIARELGVDRWLMPVIAGMPGASEPNRAGVPAGCRAEAAGPDADASQLTAFLAGLDHLLFVERPYFEALPALARQLGIAVTCVANWEWLHPGLNWIGDVDLMIAPTRCAAAMLERWKRQFGFAWQVVYLPWPIDSRNFEFRERRICRHFLFVNGAGGLRPRRLDGSPADFCRKGFDVICRAARLVPEIPVIAYSQVADVPPLPPNVKLRPPPERNVDLYHEGEICLQPSHWEGLGLPLLECQAAGLPLVTTGAPPMNEHNPIGAIPAEDYEVVSLPGAFQFVARSLLPEALADLMRSLFRRDVRLESHNARRFVEREHGWCAGWRRFQELLRKLPTGRSCDMIERGRQG